MYGTPARTQHQLKLAELERVHMMTQLRDAIFHNISTFYRDHPNNHDIEKRLLARHLIWDVLGDAQHGVEFTTAMHSGDIIMAYKQKTFAALTIDANRAKDYAEWAGKNAMGIAEIAENFLGEGYKLSIVWVTDSNAFCLSVIGTDDMRVNADAIMSSWSDDLEETFMIAAYKHFVLCDNGEWPTANNGSRWG